MKLTLCRYRGTLTVLGKNQALRLMLEREDAEGHVRQDRGSSAFLLRLRGALEQIQIALQGR